MTTLARFESKLDKTGSDHPVLKTPCWVWLAGLRSYEPGKRYGSFRVNGRTVYSHKFSYETYRGKVPSGLVLDHLCRNTLCANPHHLEVVTNQKNILRGLGLAAQNASKTECPQGHRYDKTNTLVAKNGRRYCRVCGRAQQRRYYAERKTNGS